jgi:hypothetical protein
LLAGAGWVGGGPGAAQIPDEPDDRRPVPPDPGQAERAAKAEKFRIPNTDRAIFKGRRDPRTGKLDGGITDLLPLATEKENPDEYWAWHEVVLHARQFAAAELEEAAARDLTRDDLTEERTRSRFRLDLVRFDGKLTKVRRFPPTRSLEDAGLAEMYEALIVPFADPPTDAVSVVFTDLPEALAGVRGKKPGEWFDLPADPDAWATGAGFFFKVKLDAPGGDPAEQVPVLVARSVTPHKGPPPAPDPKNPAAPDAHLRVFRFIRDDARIAKAEDNWEEVAAWNRVLLHARRFLPEDLERYARWDVSFADLFLDARRDFKLDLIGFEGRLIMLNAVKPGRKLEAAGIETVYEGWLVPRDEPRGNPVCVVFTDPPEGVEATGRVNKWVSFAGFSFKLMRYESGERDKDDPSRKVVKRAPLLLGRAVIPRPDPDGPTPVSWRAFANGATAIILGVLAVAGGMTWWFRRGDRRAKQELDAHRARNPFGGQA